MAVKMLLIPGIGGSSEAHWQSLWHRSDPNAFHWPCLSRDELEEPRLARWVEAIDQALETIGSQAVVAAHSLGCLALAHWAARGPRKLLGALLVSPPDPGGPSFPNAAAEFGPAPVERLDFPSIIVVSADDSYLTIDYARAQARRWGSQLCALHGGSHLGDSAGLGDWPLGRSLIKRLAFGK